MSHDGMVKVELHGLDGEVETLWATPVGPDEYQLENSPFFAYGISWLDIVEAHAPAASPDDFPIFTRVVTPSGHRTLRLILQPRADRAPESQAILDHLVALGASYEGLNPGYLAIDVPPAVDLELVTDYLTSTGQRWEYANPTYEQLFGSAEEGRPDDDALYDQKEPKL
jgi:hypothetical protein